MAKLMKIAQIGFVAFAMMIWTVNAIAQVTTTTSVTASPNPIVVGQSTTLTATVIKASGMAIPSGTVTFYDDGATPPGTVDLNSTAHASLVVSNFGLGNHNITAAYTGFSGSTSSPVAVTVNPAPPGHRYWRLLFTYTNGAAAIDLWEADLLYGGVDKAVGGTTSAYSFYAPENLVPAQAFGKNLSTCWASAFDGAVPIWLACDFGSPVLVDTVTLTPATSVDRTSNPWTVQFSDDGVNGTDVVTFDTPSGWAVGVTRSFSIPQLGQNTTTTLASSANPATVGTPVTFTARVSPSSATGKVTFAAEGTTLATVALASGQATFATSAFAVGTHSMMPAYGGDANDNPSTSAALSEVINAVSGGTSYYFAANGSDANNCTSQATACQTIARAQGITYAPGSSINFRGGDSFTGCWSLNQTNVPSKGDKNNPITIQSYGTGTATLRANCPGNLTALLLIDGVSGVTVQNLTFAVGGQASAGIWVQNSPATPTVDTITLQNLDVSGVLNTGPGNFSSEIFIAGNAFIGGGGCGPLNNIKVLNSKLHGATVTSHDDNGINGSGCGNVTNVLYSGNEVWNIGGHANAIGGAAANGIVANQVVGGEVSYNLIHDIGANTNTCGGPTGAMGWQADQLVVQFNEIYNVQPAPDVGGCDFAAIDFDGGVTNSIAQYNYTHDNAGAAWVICCGAGDGNVIRYNISQNDDKYYKSGGVVAVSDVVFKIYNNTIWIPPVGTDPNHAQACYVFGFSGTFPVGALIANNICYAGSPNQWGAAWYADSGGQVPPDIANVEVTHNLYNDGGLWHINSGVYHSLAEVQAIGKEAGSVVSDPKVTNPGGGGTCAWDPTRHNDPQPCPAAYRLLTGSPGPGLDAGVNLQAAPYNLNVGTRDYYGNPITTTPNIGAD